MSQKFFDAPVLNSPYRPPRRHWVLGEDGQPTQEIAANRRPAAFITPIPKPRKQHAKDEALVFDEGQGLSTQEQQYERNAVIINSIRRQLNIWRALPETQWQVTPQSAHLLRHWRTHKFGGIRPFFCQVEAVETVIWLCEVAPKQGKTGQGFLEHLENAANETNPGLLRLALKLATGAGKTTVMAMLIAWQTINAKRNPRGGRFTDGFLVVTPGITIRDRLRVLQPNDPDSYYQSRELVPPDMLGDLAAAKIVITNYHAFMRRTKTPLTKGGRELLQGRGADLDFQESEGQMLQRVMPNLMGMKNIWVLNDEAHHCYRAKADAASQETKLDAEEMGYAKQNRAAARLWISGLEAVHNKLGVARVLDLSATPFFLRGSGYAEGTLFPWTMCDFSLMDAIECGIVKLPRVPVADNIPSGEMPMYRELWPHIKSALPRKGRSKAGALDPLKLPQKLKTALDTLYGHYSEVFAQWQGAGIDVPPCFIVVCNNTATSKLVYDYIAGFQQQQKSGGAKTVPGRLELFRNFGADGRPLQRPRTLLIDSEQLESGEALQKDFRQLAAPEIERFRRERITRGGGQAAAAISDEELLREVMNTVGKAGRLGDSIRCVVSVAMLSEGWDASSVTHVLGVRAFGTQLLCEQVVGRALRRQNYETNAEGLLEAEYADVFGIPFDFTAKPVVATPKPPRKTLHIHAVRPERDHLEITFPRVAGYRVDAQNKGLRATFTEDSALELTPDIVGATEVTNSGIIGKKADLSLRHLQKVRQAQVVFELATHLLTNRYRDENGAPRLELFGQLKGIVRHWTDNYLHCRGGTGPAQLKYKELAERACEKITAGIHEAAIAAGEAVVSAVLDPYNPAGSTAHVNFKSSAKLRWQCDAERCHINWAVLDSGWESELCRVAEAHPRVKAYVKNHNLGFSVPYRSGGEAHNYVPDFIVLVDDGRGQNEDDLLRLVVEVKGYRGEDAKAKKQAMETYWLPGVNRLGEYGRWAFAELTDPFAMPEALEAAMREQFGTLIGRLQTGRP